MNGKDALVVACIPAYCEESTIAGVILSAQKYVDRVLVCDDGSPDMTGQIAERLGATVINHEKNMGKGNALKTLLGTAMKLNADVTVLIDGDGQHNANEIPALVEPILESKADIVLGSRYLNGAQVEAPAYRRSGLKVLNFLHKKVTKLPFTDAECGFRALSRKALDAVCFFENGGYGADVEMLSLARKKGLTVVEVPVVVKYNGLKKTSKKTPLAHGGELVANILRLVTEEHPLTYLAPPGALLVLLGISAALYMVWKFDTYKMLSLHAMMAAYGMTVAGLLLLATALILYILGRINRRINDFANFREHNNADEQS